LGGKRPTVLTFIETSTNLAERKEEMGLPSDRQERRSYPRRLTNLPVDFRIIDNPHPHFGLVLNASEAGLRIQTFQDMPVGRRINIEVLSPEVGKVLGFRSVVEIIWKDIYAWDDWESYQYGLKFPQIPSEDYLKFRHLFKNSPTLGT
jgi:hypothetical protein